MNWNNIEYVNLETLPPIKLITSYFIVVYDSRYTGPNLTNINIDTTWFSEHGVASTTLQANVIIPNHWVTPTEVTKTEMDIAEALVTSHKSKNLYYALGLPGPELATTQDFFNEFVARGMLPGINDSYLFYIQEEVGPDWLSDDSWGGVTYYNDTLTRFSNIINWVKTQVGDHPMIFFMSPVLSNIGYGLPLSPTNFSTHYKAWLDDLGDAVGVSAIPTDLITSVFLVDYGYSGANDPQISIDAKWFSEHGIASLVNTSNMLTQQDNSQSRLDIIAATATAHRNYNLYYATSLASQAGQSYDGEWFGCSVGNWPTVRTNMKNHARESYDLYIAQSILPGINGSYHVYIDLEFWLDGFGTASYYDRTLDLWTVIINELYPLMPNPGTNKMVVFFSPFIGSVSGSTTVLTTYYRNWLEALGTAVNLSSRSPNLKLVSMLQDGVGVNPSRRPGESSYTAMQNFMHAHYTACSTTFGSDIVGKVNMELFRIDDGVYTHASIDSISTLLLVHAPHSVDNVGAAFAWHPYTGKADFINGYHLYYSGPADLKLVSAVQDGVGSWTYLSTGNQYSDVLAYLSAHYTACSTTKHGTNILGKVNPEIFRSVFITMPATSCIKDGHYQILTLGETPQFTTFGSATSNTVALPFISYTSGSGTGTVRDITDFITAEFDTGIQTPVKDQLIAEAAYTDNIFGPSWAWFDWHGLTTFMDSYHTYYSGGSGLVGYAFGCAKDDYLYLAPCYNADYSSVHGNFVRYRISGSIDDPSSWEFFDGNINPLYAKGFHGSVAAGDYIYYAPLWSNKSTNTVSGNVARYNTTTAFTSASSWEVVDISTFPGRSDWKGFIGNVYDGRYVYFVPYGVAVVAEELQHGKTARYDTTSIYPFTDVRSWQFFDLTSIVHHSPPIISNNLKGYQLGCYDGSRYIYYAPNSNSPFIYHGNVVRYDTTLSFDSELSWDVINLRSINLEYAGFCGCVKGGNYIYFVQNYNGTGSNLVARYNTLSDFTNPASWQFIDISTLGSFGGYAGIAYDGISCVYLAPDFNLSLPDPYMNSIVAKHDVNFDIDEGWEFMDMANKDSHLVGHYGVVYEDEKLFFISVHQHTSVASGWISRYNLSEIPVLVMSFMMSNN